MRLKLGFSLIWLLVACQPQTFKDEFIVFGTVVKLEIVGETTSKAQLVGNLIQAEFDLLHSRWHAWQPGGLLAKINTAIANNQAIKLTPTIISFLQYSQQLSKISGYRFNPAIGNLVALWGFHDNAKTSKPSQLEIEKYTKPPITMDSLQFIDGQLISTDKRVKIDLGGIAKGYAIDLAIKILQQNNIKHAVVNAGGDLRVIGNKNQRQWLIGINHPDGSIIGSIKLNNGESVVSSGDYARAYKINNFKVHHIINPQTGYPSTGLSAVTVIANNATLADAAATAILVAGVGDWQQVAKSLQIESVLVVDNSGKLMMTPGMQTRVELTQK